MDPHLTRKQTIGIGTGNGEGCTLESRLFTFLVVEHLGFPTLLLGPAQIHSEQHLRPILGFRSSRTGVDTHNRVFRVVFSPKELLDLRGIDLLLQLLQMFLKIFRNRLPLLRPLDESADFFFASVEMMDQVHIVLKVTSFSGQLLPLGGIGPNGRIGQLLF